MRQSNEKERAKRRARTLFYLFAVRLVLSVISRAIYRRVKWYFTGKLTAPQVLVFIVVGFILALVLRLIMVLQLINLTS